MKTLPSAGEVAGDHLFAHQQDPRGIFPKCLSHGLKQTQLGSALSDATSMSPPSGSRGVSCAPDRTLKLPASCLPFPAP